MAAKRFLVTTANGRMYVRFGWDEAEAVSNLEGPISSIERMPLTVEDVKSLLQMHGVNATTVRVHGIMVTLTFYDDNLSNAREAYMAASKALRSLGFTFHGWAIPSVSRLRDGSRQVHEGRIVFEWGWE